MPVWLLNLDYWLGSNLRLGCTRTSGCICYKYHHASIRLLRNSLDRRVLLSDIFAPNLKRYNRCYFDSLEFESFIIYLSLFKLKLISKLFQGSIVCVYVWNWLSWRINGLWSSIIIVALILYARLLSRIMDYDLKFWSENVRSTLTSQFLPRKWF